MNKTEADFSAALTENMKKAGAVLSADFSRELAQIEKNGALRWVQTLLKRGIETPGFDQLAERGQLSLSVEAVVVRAAFGALFTDDEINLCFDRLCEQGYYNVR